VPTILNPYAHSPGTASSAVERLSLTGGLKLCLDASDIASYGGSGQVWSDTSGNDYHFNRGTGSGSDSADPTFNGTAGQQSSAEYWGFDGGDFLTLGQSNPTWVNNLHKNNAKFVLACWVYIADTDADRNNLFGTAGDSVQAHGIGWQVRPKTNGGVLMLNVANGDQLTLSSPGVTSVTEGAWSFLAVSVDEAEGSGFVQVRGTQDSISTTYSSPSTAAATRTAQIGASGLNGAFPNPILNGGRLSSFLAWEGTIPAATDLLNLYGLTKSKFGL
jgi:hypothetical protein